MSQAVEKTVRTLGESLAEQTRRLSRRHRPGVSWVDLLQPVIERNEARTAGGGRFERREAVPGRRRSPAAPAQDGFPAGPGEDGFPAGPAQDGYPAAPAQPRYPAGPAQVGYPAGPSPDGPSPDGFPGGPEFADAGEPVSAAVRDRLRPVLGSGVDLARVHTDAGADAFARSQRADAVTVGRDIYFRSGSFDPRSSPGLGLLAHELTHVAEGERPDAGLARARPWGDRQEEDRARAVEQRLARAPVSPLAAQAYAPPVQAPAPALGPAAGGGGAAAGAPQPMRAASDRPAADPGPVMPNADRLRQTLVRDIMAQIRVEFERGS